MPATLNELNVAELPAKRIIGRKISCKVGHPDGNPIPGFWGRCLGDGTIQQLQTYEAIREPVPAFGWIGNFDDSAQTFDYVVAALAPVDAEPFAGAFVTDLPASRYGVGTIEGTIPDLFMTGPDLVRAELERRGLRRHGEHRFEMEAYDHRFTHDTPTTIIEYWVPLAR